MDPPLVRLQGRGRREFERWIRQEWRCKRQILRFKVLPYGLPLSIRARPLYFLPFRILEHTYRNRAKGVPRRLLVTRNVAAFNRPQAVLATPSKFFWQLSTLRLPSKALIFPTHDPKFIPSYSSHWPTTLVRLPYPMHRQRPSVIRLDWRDRRRSFFECRMLHDVAIGAGASDGAPPMMMRFPSVLPSEEPGQCRSRMVWLAWLKS